MPTGPKKSEAPCHLRGARNVRPAAQPMNVTYCVAMPFDLDDEGVLAPGEAKEIPTAVAAERQPQSLVRTHAVAVAFSRSGDPSIGEFQDAVILAQFGDVDLNALYESAPPVHAGGCFI